MVNSYVYYTGDGSTTNFQITFDYLSKEFVQVYLDGVLLEVETDYIFAGDRTILITSIPPNGSSVFIRRVTSKDRLVEFRDASILVANDLDVSALQAIHIAEEANDNIQNVIQTDPNGNFDALNRRLVNVAAPVDDTDGANKLYVDTRLAADVATAVATAVAAKDAAVVAQGLSEGARDAAQGFANAANISAGLADIRAQDAAGSAVVAAQSVLDAQAAADSIGVMQSRGVLLTGQDTITLTWTYNPTLKNVAVYLDGVKQDSDTALSYTGVNTITLTEPVTKATNWEVISVTLAGDSTLSGYVGQCQTIVNNAALSNLPVGSLIWVTGVNAPAGFIVGDGELRSRAAFPDLWAFAQVSGNISVDDASWTFGQYSPGNGSTTFRVPKVDDRFIRGKSGTRAVGLVEEDAIRNITGRFETTNADDSIAKYGNTVTGAFSRIGGSDSFAATNSGTVSNAFKGAVFDASNVVPTADENRPKALTMLPCIKAYDVISDPNVLNAVAVVNEISRLESEISRLESEKLRKDENINLGVPVAASGTAVDFVGIPEGVKRITVMFDRVSTSGSSGFLVKVGTSSGIEDSGYSCGSANGAGSISSSVSSNGFNVIRAGVNANFWTIKATFDLFSTNNWVGAWVGGQVASGGFTLGGGSKTLSGALDRIRITTVNGTDLFDAGTINISWEF